MQLYSSATPNLYAGTVNTVSKGAMNLLYYKGTSKRAYFCFNGQDETTGPVSQLLKNLPLGLINANWQPQDSFFCIQGFGWASTADQNAVYAQMKALLGFTQIAMIGLSEGAWRATVILMQGKANPIAADTVAFLCMSSQADDSVDKPAAPIIAGLGITVIGTGDALPGPTVDGHAQFTQAFINELLAAKAGGPFKFYDTPGTGHGGFQQNCSPTSTLYSGTNIYAVFDPLFTGGTVVTPPPPPPVTITSLTIGYSDGTKYTPTKPVRSALLTFTDGTTTSLP
jgi:hypothetical protein